MSRPLGGLAPSARGVAGLAVDCRAGPGPAGLAARSEGPAPAGEAPRSRGPRRGEADRSRRGEQTSMASSTAALRLGLAAGGEAVREAARASARPAMPSGDLALWRTGEQTCLTSSIRVLRADCGAVALMSAGTLRGERARGLGLEAAGLGLRGLGLRVDGGVVGSTGRSKLAASFFTGLSVLMHSSMAADFFTGLRSTPGDAALVFSSSYPV